MSQANKFNYRGKFYKTLLGLLVASQILVAGCAAFLSGTKSVQLATIQITPSSLNFGNVALGNKVSQSLLVRNTGPATINITAATLSSPQFTVSGVTFPFSLVAGSTANLSVSFSGSTKGSVSGTLILKTDTGSISAPVTLSAMATVAGAQLTPSPTTVSFGATTIGTSASSPVTLTNTGSSDLRISVISVNGAAFGVSGITTPATISAGQSAILNATYSPTSTGNDSGSISITSNDPASPTTIGLSGTGTTTPLGRLAFSPPSLSFGNVTVGKSSTLSSTLTNTGQATVHISGVSTPGNGFTASGVSAGTTLAKGQSTTIQVGFAPATAGAASSSISITSDASGSLAPLSLSGTGVTGSGSGAPTISITSPSSGSIVSGTVTITASASAAAGVSYVQYQLDGANLSSLLTTSPYVFSWDTTKASNGSHALKAIVTDGASRQAASSPVTISVNNSAGGPPPPPPPAGDQVRISNTSGSAISNRPVSVARPFAQGEIANFAQASINGTALLTQCDVKNRWPDGSLKFAIVSFVVPSIPVNGSVAVSFANQTTGNNTGSLAKTDMLATAYNFDGQIQLSGNANHSISARAILNAASSCVSPTNDPDGTITNNLCTYWLQGPIVTAVVLEDRAGRSFDVNTDSATGNPLHPRFEAWFYPSTNQVQLGYTLENIWASTTPSNSARNQALSGVVLTGGNASPVTEFSNGAFTMITRSMFHKTYCVNGPNAGSQFDCVGSSLHIDNSWPYLATTRAFPHWDPTQRILSSAIAGEYSGLFNNTQALTLQGCPTGSCVGGSSGIANYPTAIDAAGASPHHGIVPTWDTFYLMSQCDAGASTNTGCGNGSKGDMRAVMLTNADLAGAIPYWFREADRNAGHGQTFDNSGTPGNVQTLGRVVSINARTQVSLQDVTSDVNGCNNNYPADYINYGGSGQDTGAWETDTTHWPNIAYSSYVSTGQYHYYETQMMQSANALGNSPGSRACTQSTSNGSLRMGSLGYWYKDDERGTSWTKRENIYGAFLAVDGSPEKAYFLDKLSANLAIEEALHGIPNDIGSNYGAAYSFGQTNRCNGTGYCPATLFGPLGVWNAYNSGYVGDGQPPSGNTFFATGSGKPVPTSADSNFQAAFSAVMVGLAHDMGFTSDALPQYVAKRYIHMTQDPTANIYALSDYVFPTTDQNGNWFTSFSAMAPYYASVSTHWPGIGGGTCQGGDEPYDLEGLAAFSYGYTYNDAGFSAATGWNLMRSQLQPCWSDTTTGIGFAFDPKWDITPRTSSGGQGSGPSVSITSPASGSIVSSTITLTASATSSVGVATVQFNLDGSAVGTSLATSPYAEQISTTSWSNGSHSLTATATDKSGIQTTSAPVSITVNNSTGTTPPTVSITSPANGATVSGTISVTATASAKVGVPSVQFEVDGTAFGALDTTSPYSQPLNTAALANGNHTLTAVATDASNNKATSTGVSITVNNTSASPAAIAFASPVSGAKVSGEIAVTATTFGNSSIANVQFELDGTNLGTAMGAPPYSQIWNTKAVTNGQHTLTATATSTNGSQASANAVVAVNNGATPPGIGWTKISFSELTGPENTSPCPSNGFNGYTPDVGGFSSQCHNVIVTWSSGMADPLRNRFILWGGGHDDANNNEIYSVELNNVGTCTATTPCIERLNVPSPPNTVNAFDVETLPAATVLPLVELPPNNLDFFGCLLACGPFSLPTHPAPNSRHTYDGLVYSPANDSMYSFGGSLNSNGNPSPAIWQLPLSTATSSCAPNCDPTWTNVATVSPDLAQVGVTTDYDPNTALIWQANQTFLGSFNPATSTYRRAAFTSTTYFATGIIDPVHEYFLYIGGFQGVPGQPTGVTYWSIAPGSSYQQIQPALGSGCNPAAWGSYPGLAWDPIDRVVVIYPNRGNVLYLLDTATWGCTTETHGSTLGVDYPQSTAVTQSGASTFKHFAYFQNIDTYVLCNDPTKDCWMLHRH